MPAQDKSETLAEMVARGIPGMKAAAQLGLSPAAAKAVLSSPLHKALVEKYQGDKLQSIEKQLQDKLEEALPDLIDAAIYLATHAKAETTRLKAIELCAKWSGKVKAEDQKNETLITVVIEGEAATRLQALDDTLRTIELSRGKDYQ